MSTKKGELALSFFLCRRQFTRLPRQIIPQEKLFSIAIQFAIYLIRIVLILCSCSGLSDRLVMY